MKEIEGLGNTELCKCFIASHYKMNKETLDEIYELNKDPRIDSCREKLDELRGKIASYRLSNLDLYNLLLNEAQKRGLKVEANIYKMILLICTDEFNKWREKMLDTPTYIREVKATDFRGDMVITDMESANAYKIDYPVRQAVALLNEKGYETYYSSANIDDAINRKGHAIKDKNVAYILIKPYNLSEELKEKLLLDGACNFWGIAEGYGDDHKYYGIWVEITSPDMLCDEVSDALVKKAKDLPYFTRINSADILSDSQKKH